MLPLMLGYVVIALLLTYVVVLSASGYIARRELFTVADAAAVAAADAFELDRVRLDASGKPVAVLDQRAAERAAEQYVASLGDVDAKVTDVVIEGNQVRVTVSGVWDVPLAGSILPHGFEISVTAASRVQFQ